MAIEEIARRALAHGLAVLSGEPTVAASPGDQRLIPPGSFGIAIGRVDGGFGVVWPLDHLPGDAELSAIEAAVGTKVVTHLAYPATYDRLRRPVAPGSSGSTDGAEIARMVAAAAGLGASDLHLRAGEAPTIRRLNQLTPLSDWDALDPDGMARFLAELGIDADRLHPGRTGECDLGLTIGDRRVRVHAFLAQGEPAAALRLLPPSVPALADLGLPEIVVETIRGTRRGIVLVTGPTGQGKSTTLAALAEQVLTDRGGLLVTIEDPVEYILSPAGGRVLQREVGKDTASFASGVRAAMREDPDIILIGEMRDPETMAAALTAAVTGHLVLTTVHAGDARETVERIIDAFPAAQQGQIATQLAGGLALVCSQALLRRRDDPNRRMLLCEVALNRTDIRSHITERSFQQLRSAIQTAAHGHISWERTLAKAVAAGQLSEDTARPLAPDPEIFNQYLGARTGANGPR